MENEEGKTREHGKAGKGGYRQGKTEQERNRMMIIRELEL